MNWVDVISLAAWVAGASVGFAAGFIKIMIPFMFVASGVGFAGALAFAFGPSLFRYMETEDGQAAAAFLAVFVALQLLGGLIAYLVRHSMSILSSLVSVFPIGSLFNKGGGLAGGIFAACLFVSVILIALQQLPVGGVASAIEESSFAHEPIGWVDRFVAVIEIAGD